MPTGQFAKGPLDRASYWDPSVFERERRTLFRAMPLFADHEFCLAEAGKVRRIGIGDDSILVARGIDGDLHALANHCAHRGFPIIEEDSCVSRELVCRYHGWRYALDGRLQSARGLTSGACDHPRGLVRLGCASVGGLVVASHSPIERAAFAEIEAILVQFGLAGARFAVEDRFVARCNWKLWVENFLECWHCAPNHPELSATEAHVRQFETGDHGGYASDIAAVYRSTAQAGLSLHQGIELNPGDRIFTFCEIAPLGQGRTSPTPNGNRIGPTLANDALEGCFAYGAIGPFLHFSIAVDYAVIFSFLPLDVDRTEIRICWYAAGNVDSSALTWLWRRTLRQDRSLVEAMHGSVGSTLYRGGLYLEHEQRTARFISWLHGWGLRDRSAEG